MSHMYFDYSGYMTYVHKSPAGELEERFCCQKRSTVDRDWPVGLQYAKIIS